MNEQTLNNITFFLERANTTGSREANEYLKCFAAIQEEIKKLKETKDAPQNE